MNVGWLSAACEGDTIESAKPVPGKFRMGASPGQVPRREIMEKEAPMFERILGRSGIRVNALGLGCAVIGGQLYSAEGRPLGWDGVDDGESVRAIRRCDIFGISS
jgi:hypothetical protein